MRDAMNVLMEGEALYVCCACACVHDMPLASKELPVQVLFHCVKSQSNFYPFSP